MNNFDIVLFNNASGLIYNRFTPKTWDNVGLVLIDPTWLLPGLTGTYLWKMCDDCDQGAQLIPFEEYTKGYKGRIYLRSVINPEKINQNKVKHVSDKLQPSVRDAIISYLHLKPQDIKCTNGFLRPALLCFILIRMNYLNFFGTKHWETIKANDFAPSGRIENYLLPGLEYSNKLVMVR